MPSSRKFTIGIFLIGGLLLFTIGLFWIGDRRQLFEKSIEVQAEFRELSGLKNGSTVLVAGMEAGEVMVISVPTSPEAKFRVRFRVLEEFRPILRLDSVASIQMDGLVGNKILQVEAGSKQAREVRDGDTIQSREPLEISDVMQEAVDTVRYARGAVDDIKGGVDQAVDTLAGLNKEAIELINDVGGDVKKITATGDRIALDAGEIIEGVKKGRGTVGKLVTDDRLYDQLRETMREAELTVQNLQQTSTDLKEVASDIKSADLAGKMEQTVENVREITEKGKEAMSALLPTGTGEEGMATSLRQTLTNANEAMSDFAENAEALKRNWFFRGFFNKRGFFDLDGVSVDDYQAGRFAPDRLRQREWLDRTELFEAKPDGTEELSEEGRKKLNAAMATLLRHARNNPIMVEGYASQGTPDEQFLQSLERASKVRTYVIRKFQLKPDYVGVMPMGAVTSSAPDGKPWDGVSVVLFLPKAKGRGSK